MKKSIWIYGALMGVLFAFLQVIEYRYALRDLPTSILIGVLALIFISLGIWVGVQFSSKKTIYKNQPSKTELQKRLSLLNISAREFEVLELINKGHSNQQIADKLFISLSTVKSHTSNLYSKMNVKRRTQVLQKARELEIIG